MDSKKVRNIISGLKKASRLHASQAKQLERMLKQNKK